MKRSTRSSGSSSPAEREKFFFALALQAKGLEYDGVVVVAPDRIIEEAPGGVRVLYVALTRPTQRLVTLDVGAPGAWRDGVSPPAGHFLALAGRHAVRHESDTILSHI